MINFSLNNIKERNLAKSKIHLLNDKENLLYSFKKTKTVFIHIPKTAGISLINAIYGDVKGEATEVFIFINIFWS